MFELKKTGFVKRASAWLLDAILLAVVVTGFMYVIGLICNYSHEEALARQYYAEWEDFRKEYIGKVAEYYGFVYEESENGEDFTITKDGVPATLDDVTTALDGSLGDDPATAEAYAKLLSLTPKATVDTQYAYVYTLLFMIISLGIFLGYLAMEFIIPAILKNGQTIGKKVFAIGLVRPDCVRMPTVSLFARTVLGKFAVETMFPVLLVLLFFFGGLGVLAIVLLAALFILNVVLFFATKNKTPIHDIFANTVVVDMKLQMIYASEEELNEQKALLKRGGAEKPKSYL